MVDGEGDVEARGAVELDVGTFEEFEGWFVEAAFCGKKCNVLVRVGGLGVRRGIGRAYF